MDKEHRWLPSWQGTCPCRCPFRWASAYPAPDTRSLVGLRMDPGRARGPLRGHRLHGCGAGPRRRPRGPAGHGRHRRSTARHPQLVPRRHVAHLRLDRPERSLRSSMVTSTSAWPPAWDHALAARWDGVDVWFHGDLAPGNLLSHGADWSPSSTSAPAVWVTHPATSRSPGHSSTARAARAFANNSTSTPQPGREVADGRCGSRCVSSATPSTTVTRPRQPSPAGSSTDSWRTSASRLERGQRATLPFTGLAVLLSRTETRCEWWAGGG